MLTALIFTAVVFGGRQEATPATETYTDPQLGLSFAHPKSWVLEKQNAGKDKSKKKDKAEAQIVHFRIPIAGASEDAELEVMRASFSGSPDEWEQIQTVANKNEHKTVDRQWQQEILGVPMLLTRISSNDGGSNHTTLTGLLYNDAPSKLLFRLTGPSGDFDKVQYDFDQSLQTLRTTSNELPKAQDPDHPSTASKKVDPRGLKHVLIAPPPPPPVKLAPVAIPVVVATKKVELHVPKGWSAEKVDGSTVMLRTPELPFPVQVKLASALDSDPAGSALLAASGASLVDFTAVEHREDVGPITNAGGCQVIGIWRTGKGANGAIISLDAAAAEGDFYLIATCRPTPGPTYLAQRKVLEDLLQEFSINPVP
jgi:hypothetical protein